MGLWISQVRIWEEAIIFIYCYLSPLELWWTYDVIRKLFRSLHFTVFLIGQILSIQQVCIKGERKFLRSKHRHFRSELHHLLDLSSPTPTNFLLPFSILKEKGESKNCLHMASLKSGSRYTYLHFPGLRLAFTLVHSLNCHQKEYNTEGRKKQFSYCGDWGKLCT